MYCPLAWKKRVTFSVTGGTLNRMEETHFSELLTDLGTDPNAHPEIVKRVLPTEGEMEAESEPLSEEEIEEGVNKLKNHRAPGHDGLPAEHLRAGGSELVKTLQDLLQTVWEDEVMPSAWKTSIICPIHKKGNRPICTNYIGISLLTSGYKVLSNIILARLLPYASRAIGPYQCGFRRGKSTVNQIFSLRTILERGYEHQLKTHHLFIDFRAAYDSIK